ncbi:MAG: hypothetical protein U5L02_09500 [Rheinheimera sp.]|nr:hypothetical protein [Rheinheimera sp.]
MSLNDFIKHRPFEPDAEVLELLRNWPAPDFQAAPQKKTSKTNALYTKRHRNRVPGCWPGLWKRKKSNH